MSDTRVAYRYAKPLLEEALAQNALEEVYQNMILLLEAGKMDRRFIAIMKNPIIRHHKKLAILEALFASKQLHKITDNLFKLLTAKKREAIVYEIAQTFQNMYNEHHNIQEVAVTSAMPLSANIRDEIQNLLSKSLNKTIKLHEKVNPEIIGGFIVRVGDKQIDNSIRNSLQKLKLKFVNTVL